MLHLQKQRGTESLYEADIKVTTNTEHWFCPSLLCQVDYRSHTHTTSLIRDKDQFSGEELAAWEHLWMAAVFCWVRITGMRPRRSAQPPPLASGVVGMRERLTGFCRVFSSAGRRSLWLRSCSTAWHFGSKVLTPPQTKRERNQFGAAAETKCDVRSDRMVRKYNPASHLPTSLNTLSRFVAFMMKSGYPTMLYIASACDTIK